MDKRMAAALLCTLLLAGACGDDDSPTSQDPAPKTGSVQITVEPVGLDAPWALEAPDGGVVTGSGAETFEGVAIGTYTITWGEVPGRVSPEPVEDSQLLGAGQAITFSGVFESMFLPTEDGVVPAEQARNNLVQNLQNAYRLLYYEEYEKLIHRDYVFRVDPAEIDIVGAAEWSAFEDLESTFAMFNGETGLEPRLDPVTGLPTGEFDVVPAVQTIELDLRPDSASSWTLMEDGEFAGSWRRVYNVDMTITYSGDGRIDMIRGKQVFYVTKGTLEGDTGGRLFWQLIAWQDRGVNSSQMHLRMLPPAPRSVGRLKAAY